MLVRHPTLNAPHRLAGFLAVAGLHAVALSALFAVSGPRAPPSESRAVEVRLIEAPSQRHAQPTLPSFPTTLRRPPAVPLPPLPEIAIEAPVPILTLPATAATGSPTPPPLPSALSAAPVANGALAGAKPVLIQHIEYAHFEPPVYPPLSRRLGEQGLVVVRVQIDEQGRPVAVAVSASSGFARLDDAAVRAVRAARFRPHFEGAYARPAYALVPIRFDLT